MNLEAAREWLARGDDSIDDEVTAAAVVLARLTELEAGEVTTEWGTRWPNGSLNVFETEDEAHAEILDYPEDRPVLVSRRVGPWTEAT